jgi:hypothetical protein
MISAYTKGERKSGLGFIPEQSLTEENAQRYNSADDF